MAGELLGAKAEVRSHKVYLLCQENTLEHASGMESQSGYVEVEDQIIEGGKKREKRGVSRESLLQHQCVNQSSKHSRLAMSSITTCKQSACWLDMKKPLAAWS